MNTLMSQQLERLEKKIVLKAEEEVTEALSDPNISLKKEAACKLPPLKAVRLLGLYDAQHRIAVLKGCLWKATKVETRKRLHGQLKEAKDELLLAEELARGSEALARTLEETVIRDRAEKSRRRWKEKQSWFPDWKERLRSAERESRT